MPYDTKSRTSNPHDFNNDILILIYSYIYDIYILPFSKYRICICVISLIFYPNIYHISLCISYYMLYITRNLYISLRLNCNCTWAEQYIMYNVEKGADKQLVSFVIVSLFQKFAHI